MSVPTLDPERYRLGLLLGQGGFGTVFQAEDRQVGRPVALKLLSADAGGAALERFRREAELAAGLVHPGIVGVHAFGMLKGKACIVYELVRGARTLDDVTRTEPLRRRVERVRDAARALAHAHGRGVVHRDIKCANILVDDQDRVRITDFGVGLDLAAERLTHTGAMVGTLSSMSPEQVSGQRELQGPPTDVWALGVLLYRVLCGRAPFDDASGTTALLGAILDAEPASPTSIDPRVPAALSRVCLRAMSKRPSDRHADGGAFADALDDWLAGRDARSWTTPLAAVAAVAVLLGVGALLLRDRPPVVEPTPPPPTTTKALPPRPADALPDGWRRTLETMSGFELAWRSPEPGLGLPDVVWSLRLERTGPAALDGDALRVPLRLARVVIVSGGLDHDSSRGGPPRGMDEAPLERDHVASLAGQPGVLRVRPDTGELLALAVVPPFPPPVRRQFGVGVSQQLRSMLDADHLARGLGSLLSALPRGRPGPTAWKLDTTVWLEPDAGLLSSLRAVQREPGLVVLTDAAPRPIDSRRLRRPDGLQGSGPQARITDVRLEGELRHDGERVTLVKFAARQGAPPREWTLTWTLLP